MQSSHSPTDSREHRVRVLEAVVGIPYNDSAIPANSKQLNILLKRFSTFTQNKDLEKTTGNQKDDDSMSSLIHLLNDDKNDHHHHHQQQDSYNNENNNDNSNDDQNPESFDGTKTEVTDFPDFIINLLGSLPGNNIIESICIEHEKNLRKFHVLLEKLEHTTKLVKTLVDKLKIDKSKLNILDDISNMPFHISIK